jgi:transcriptional regulator with XRE-family HTH domain
VNTIEPAPGDEPLAARLGSRIQARRRELSLTLATLSERSGVSVSYLSAVEKGVNLPSLSVLTSIATALGVPIRVMLAEEGANVVRTGRIPENEGASWVSHPDLRLRIEFIRYDGPGTGRLSAGFGAHDVFVYVNSGEVTVEVSGEQFELRAGDALSARVDRDTKWVTGSGCILLWATATTTA